MIDRSTPEREKIKVLHLIDSGGLYGAEKVLLTLCSEQVKQGLEPTILSCGIPGEPPKAIELEAARLRIPCKSWRMSSGFNIKGMKEIWGWIHREGFTHLHSHGYKFNILLALTKRFKRRQVLVTTLHGYVKAPFLTKMWLFEKLDRYLLKHFDNVVVVNSVMLDIPEVRRLSVSKRVIVNGLPVALDKRDLPALEFDLRNKFDFLFLAVGRLSPEKGFDLLLEAINYLFEVDPAMKARTGVVIYGEGRLRDSLSEAINAKGLQNNVTLAGYSPYVASYMAHFDLLLMPSRTEGLPITLLEAVRANICVVASKVGGIPQVIGESSIGLIEPNSAFELGHALGEFVRDRSTFEEDSRKAYFRYIRDYSSEAMERSYFNVYTEPRVK